MNPTQTISITTCFRDIKNVPKLLDKVYSAFESFLAGRDFDWPDLVIQNAAQNLYWNAISEIAKTNIDMLKFILVIKLIFELSDDTATAYGQWVLFDDCDVPTFTQANRHELFTWKMFGD